MAVLGVTSLGHDASVALIDGPEILFAAHAERYSRRKNDGDINASLINDARQYGEIDRVVWYERPLRKRFRQLVSGQWDAMSGESVVDHLRRHDLPTKNLAFVGHHESHAAGGFYTSPFENAAVVVCDAIGEMDTITVWKGTERGLQRVWAQKYPHSLGLLYSAFTQRCGFKPNEEEYILMGMAALGEPIYVEEIERDFLAVRDHRFILNENVHRGIRGWGEGYAPENIAASIQKVTEDYLVRLMTWVREKTGMPNLVYMGGVALNCVANSKITALFDDMWIMPNPGDAGSSIGAVAAKEGRRLNWRHPYLGHDIARPFDIMGAVDALVRGEVIGVANGRAEFGPRSLGNRSIVCDPRGPLMKDRVNQIKKRERFRPFAPIVLAEHADQYFEMVGKSQYMQTVSRVRRPDLYPAITHYDGTARVQTLTQADNPNFHALLTEWHRRTGTACLLNTSLNIKGQPLVNTWDDALEFSRKYNVRVF